VVTYDGLYIEGPVDVPLEARIDDNVVEVFGFGASVCFPISREEYIELGKGPALLTGAAEPARSDDSEGALILPGVVTWCSVL